MEQKGLTWSNSEGNIDRWDQYFRAIAEFIFQNKIEESKRALLILLTETYVFYEKVKNDPFSDEEEDNSKETKSILDTLISKIKNIDNIDRFIAVYARIIFRMQESGIYHKFTAPTKQRSIGAMER